MYSNLDMLGLHSLDLHSHSLAYISIALTLLKQLNMATYMFIVMLRMKVSMSVNVHTTFQLEAVTQRRVAGKRASIILHLNIDTWYFDL